MQFSTRRTKFYTLLLFITFDAWTTTLHLSEIRTSYSILGVCRKSSRHISNSTSSKRVAFIGIAHNSWWKCAATWFSKSWPSFRPKNIIFHTRFQNWPLGRNYVIIDLSTNKNSSNPIWKCSHTPIVPSKPYLIPEPKWATCMPVFRPKGPHPLIFGPNWDLRGWKFFLRPGPPYLRVWMTIPPSYLKVWSCHCAGQVWNQVVVGSNVSPQHRHYFWCFFFR